MDQPTYSGLRRMSHSHTLITLCKVAEFYESFHTMIPDEYRQEWKNLKRSIEGKGIYEFRSKYIAHLKDDDTGRPLDQNAIVEYADRIFGKDEGPFVRWVNDQVNEYPKTVVSILERTRDEFMKVYGISKDLMEFKRVSAAG